MNLNRRARVAALAALTLALPAASTAPALAAFGQKWEAGTYGTSGSGSFKSPVFLDLDRQGDTALLGDFDRQAPFGQDPMRIVPFDAGGAPLATYPTSATTTMSILDGAVDTANRRLYLVELDRPSEDFFEPPFHDVRQVDLDEVAGPGGLHAESSFAVDSIGRMLDADGVTSTGKLEPSAIAVAPAGTPNAGDVYVAGQVALPGGAGRSRLAVMRFDRDGTKLGEIGDGNGAGPGQFNPGEYSEGILGLAVDPRDGGVWVLDGYDENLDTTASESLLGRAQHFSRDGELIEAIDSTPEHPIFAAGRSADIAVGEDGSVWTASVIEAASGESDHHYGVIRFAPAEGGYAEAQRFGSTGRGACQFPTAPLLAVDGGTVWTATAVSASPTTSAHAALKQFGDGGVGCAAPNDDPVITPGSVRASPAAPLKGAPVQLTAAATDDGGADQLLWQWDLDGDGTWDGTPSASPAATTSFDRAGPVTVKVRVTDAEGAGDEATLDLLVTSQKPTASFTASTTTPLAGETVTFDGSASSDPDGTIARYEWDTGAGFQAGGPVLQASFAAGTRTVRLRVTDADGDVSTAARRDLTVAPADGTDPGPGPGPETPPGPQERPPVPLQLDTIAPRVTIGRLTQAGLRTLRATIACPAGETTCSGTATLRSARALATSKRARRGRKARRAVLTLGSAKFTIAGGGSATVTIKLSAAARRVLARGALKARLVVAVADAAGNATTLAKPLTLKRPKASKKAKKPRAKRG